MTESNGRERLSLIPLELGEANAFVAQHHRHHGPVTGHKFSLGAVLAGSIVGVSIIGRPNARAMQDGMTLEITRLATDGTRNASSFLYGASCKAIFALGYRRVSTYTLKTESGASLRAVGFRIAAEVKGRSWNCPSRPRVDKTPKQDKFRWELAA
jgi:hypothetical protein